MHKKRLISLILGVSLLLCGCVGRSSEENEIKDLTNNSTIKDQTATTGINASKKNFEELLISGNYYVVHNDMYYPLTSYQNNYDDESPDDYVNPNRQVYFTTENEVDIPTLFEGDKLIYYSTDTLLDYMTWERFYDLGYTIGVFNIQEMTNGRMYLDLEADDDCIIADSELYEMYDLGVNQVLLDKIGNVQITSDLISDKLINAVKKSTVYDLEVYTGTQFKHYKTTANIHAFKSYELFASTEYITLQDAFYEITIPDYFVTGYYYLDEIGMLRIVKGTEYSNDTDFNEQILFPEQQKDTSGNLIENEEYVAPKIYSDNDILNKFSTNVEGKLGYVDENAVEEEQEENKDLEIKLKEASVKKIDLFFPEDRECKITINSNESTGDMYLIMEGETARRLLSYNRLEKCYDLDVVGKNEKGTLVISGLYNDYDIQLVNCEQYTNQLEALEEEIETEVETTTENEPVDETEDSKEEETEATAEE